MPRSPKISDEGHARRRRYLKTQLQLGHYLKTFDRFDFGFQSSIDERQISELRTLRFVHPACNVILNGVSRCGEDSSGE